MVWTKYAFLNRTFWLFRFIVNFQYKYISKILSEDCHNNNWYRLLVYDKPRKLKCDLRIFPIKLIFSEISHSIINFCSVLNISLLFFILFYLVILNVSLVHLCFCTIFWRSPSLYIQGGLQHFILCKRHKNTS